ncbi:hypothetical protein [Methanobacterium alcaliphilum]|uniref:hypothetical protein n=1 Tax=Methanobacterium alcaliphilum TaxID=392018 RepID=UPI00200B200E|nr:hypothetical protein [Methanobacterium alcaliphilum]MCK9152396.1 hypothetical protein [Methanobacterium alcaliphilum]
MKSIQIDNDLKSKKKLVLGLFWPIRKTIKTEGCAPVRIKQITTPNNTYHPEGRKLLKLSDEIFDDVINSMQNNQEVEFEISMGNELIELKIGDDSFSISTTKSPELEEEIVEKMELEMQRVTPDFCQTFVPKVFPQDSTRSKKLSN